MELLHKPKLDICHLCGLGVAYHVVVVVVVVDPYVHLNPNESEKFV